MHASLNSKFSGGVLRFEWGPPTNTSGNGVDEKLGRLARQLGTDEQTPDQVLAAVQILFDQERNVPAQGLHVDVTFYWKTNHEGI